MKIENANGQVALNNGFDRSSRERPSIFIRSTTTPAVKMNLHETLSRQSHENIIHMSRNEIRDCSIVFIDMELCEINWRHGTRLIGDANVGHLKELVSIKIERELRTTIQSRPRKAKRFAKASKVFVAWLPRLANAWGRRKLRALTYYDAHAKPGDTGDEVPASIGSKPSILADEGPRTVETTAHIPDGGLHFLHENQIVH